MRWRYEESETPLLGDAATAVCRHSRGATKLRGHDELTKRGLESITRHCKHSALDNQSLSNEFWNTMLDGVLDLPCRVAYHACGLLLIPSLSVAAGVETTSETATRAEGSEQTKPVVATDEAPAQPKFDRLPLFDVNLGLGLAFGGENLAKFELSDGTEQDLDAGRGVLLTLGGKVTPLWLLESIGFGIGLDFGWKYGAVTASDASLSLRRFPLVATAHGLIRVAPQWFLRVAGGLTYETGIALRGSGLLEDAKADANDALGWVGEGGVLWWVERHGAMDIGFRYTGLKYDFGYGSVDANHAALVMGFHFLF